MHGWSLDMHGHLPSVPMYGCKYVCVCMLSVHVYVYLQVHIIG